MSDIRALSVRQPWADLIMSGAKDIENRTWTTDYRGWLLIHASLKRDTSDEADQAHFLADYPGDGLRGMILGAVRLTGVIIDSPSVWALHDHFHWVLSDPVVFAQPIPATGQLGLYRPPVSSARLGRIRRQLQQLSSVG